ncbi:hypothetical protein C5167_004079 [Papaver somniferum]|nr:hypothetical protein C5167_004079 [Papaver somniferum]
MDDLVQKYTDSWISRIFTVEDNHVDV